MSKGCSHGGPGRTPLCVHEVTPRRVLWPIAANSMSRLLRVLNFGNQLVRYTEALAGQEIIADQVKKGSVPDTLILLQHFSVYTIGKRGKEQDFQVPLQEVLNQGAEVFSVPRGGETTFHGPGQLTAYPIIHLKSAKLGARAFVEGLEDTIINTVGQYGIHARGRVKGATGVWVSDRKIAAIGVKISHGVSSHGLALNVTTDLSRFSSIVPCGIADKEVTSMAKELGGAANVDYGEVTGKLLEAFMQQFRYQELQPERPQDDYFTNLQA